MLKPRSCSSGSKALDGRMIHVDNPGEVIDAGQQHAVVLELFGLQFLEAQNLGAAIDAVIEECLRRGEVLNEAVNAAMQLVRPCQEGGLEQVAGISSVKTSCIVSFALISSPTVAVSTFKWPWRVSMPTRNSLKFASNFPEV